MKMAILAGAAALMASSSAQAVVRIKSDPGARSVLISKTWWHCALGRARIIDGPCLSACTMVLGVIPRDRICVTPRARLGFHAAWHPGEDGHPIPSREATKLLMDIYPEHVRSWIARRGGLSPRMMYLSAASLAGMYNPAIDRRRYPAGERRASMSRATVHRRGFGSSAQCLSSSS